MGKKQLQYAQNLINLQINYFKHVSIKEIYTSKGTMLLDKCIISYLGDIDKNMQKWEGNFFSIKLLISI